MASLTLVWTALPCGFTPAGKLRLSAFLSPRLYGSAAENRISNYPMFTSAASPWPVRLANLTLRAQIDSQIVEVRRITEPAPDPALWAALVASTMPVTPYRYADLRSGLFLSPAIAPLLSYLNGEYGKVVAAPPAPLVAATIGAPPPDPVRQQQAERINRPIPSMVGPNGQGPAVPTMPALLPDLEALANPDAKRRLGLAAQALYTQRLQLAQASKTPRDPDTRTAQNVPAITGADIAAMAASAGVSGTTAAFYLLQTYYTPTKSESDRPGLLKDRPRPTAPKPDFHAFHGAIGDYPVLLRKLGLVVDLELDASSAPDGRLVRLLPAALPGVTHACPPTRIAFEAGTIFRPAPRSGAGAVLRNGHLPLGTTAGGAGTYLTAQGDPDSTAFKALSAATARAAYTGTAGRIGYETNVHDSNQLPVVRSGGLSLYRANRAVQTALAVQRSGDLNSGIETGMFDPSKPMTGMWAACADELVRGYVVDVRDEATGAWKSLCERKGLYTPTSGARFEADDLGFVKISAVRTSPLAGDASLVRAHEALFTWDGWSLACERPGLTVVPEELHNQMEAPPADLATYQAVAPPAGTYERVGRLKRTAPAEVPMTTAFRPVDGSLPRLRFGRRYMLRVRGVDLAGNVPPMAPGTLPSDTPWVAYSRFEPLEPPTLVPRRAFSEGESLERMVIRSDPGAPAPLYPPQYATSPEVTAATAGAWYGGYSPVCDRHVMPPRTSVQDAERHGAFDEGAWTSAGTRTALFNIARKEAGTLYDPLIVDPDTGQKTVPQPGLAIVTPPGVPGDQAAATLAGRRPGDPLGPGQYVVIGGEQAVVPFLPDPLARGVTLQNVPGAPKPLLVELGNDFPDAKPFVIRLASCPAGTSVQPSFTPAGGGAGAPLGPVRAPHRALGARTLPNAVSQPSGPATLHVFLPPAGMAEVLYSTAPKNPGPSLGPVTAPSKLPDGMNLFGLRSLVPSPSGTLDNVIKSGMHEAISPPRRLTLVHAVQRPLEAPAYASLKAERAGPLDGYGQTSVLLSGVANVHVMSTGRLDLIARWDDPVDPPTELAPRDGVDGRPIDRQEGRVAEMPIEPFYSTSLKSLPLPVTGVEGYPHAEQASAEFFRHEFGDTKRRTVRYRLQATTRFREYFHPSITQDVEKISRTGAEQTVTIPNTARPDAPKVAYVVPAFRWQTEPLPGGVLRRRCGGGLRVWLERPWYSSGEGERLAALLLQNAPAGDARLAERVTQLTSRWARDPLWGGKELPTMNLVSFLTRKEVQSSLTVPDLAGLEVAAVGHEVHFDAERRMWYCDMELDTGAAYFPFVRLALARFQPLSVPNAHLSPVTLTDFVQVVPTRTASVQREAGGAKLNIQVGGVLTPPHAFVPGVPKTLQDMVTGAQVILEDYLVPEKDNSRVATFVASVEKRTGAGTWQAVSPQLAAIPLEAVLSGNTTTDLQQMIAGQAIFGKVVDLPTDARSGVPLRVSITETEIHSMDDGAPGATNGFGGRIVYADTLDLP